MYTSLDQSDTATNSCQNRPIRFHEIHWKKLEFWNNQDNQDPTTQLTQPWPMNGTPRIAPRGCCTPRLENDSCIDISNLCLLVHSLGSASMCVQSVCTTQMNPCACPLQSNHLPKSKRFGGRFGKGPNGLSNIHCGSMFGNRNSGIAL